jgi:biopolymer transport protein ExbD
MKPKKNYHKKRGHRQELTRVMINSISLNGSLLATTEDVETPESSANPTIASEEGTSETVNSETGEMGNQEGMIEQTTLARELGEQLSQTKDPEVMSASDSSEQEREIQQITNQLNEMFNGSQEKIYDWLNQPHPDLDQKTPQFYLDQGKTSVVNNLIYATEAGIPS